MLFSRPGWAPPGVALPPAHPARASADIPRATKVYVGVQMVLTIAFSLYVFVLRDQHSMGLLLASAALLLLGLVTLGGLLDGRRGARRWEALRVVLAAVGLVALCAMPRV